MEKEEKEIVELPEEKPKILMKIKIEKAIDIRDVERIIKLVREGISCIVSIGETKRNFAEYQSLLENFKRYAKMFKINIYLLGEDFLLLTPQTIKVEK